MQAELQAKLERNIVLAATDYAYWHKEFQRLNCAWLLKGLSDSEQDKLKKEFEEAVANLKHCQDQLVKFVDLKETSANV